MFVFTKSVRHTWDMKLGIVVTCLWIRINDIGYPILFDCFVETVYWSVSKKMRFFFLCRALNSTTNLNSHFVSNRIRPNGSELLISFISKICVLDLCPASLIVNVICCTMVSFTRCVDSAWRHATSCILHVLVYLLLMSSQRLDCHSDDSHVNCFCEFSDSSFRLGGLTILSSCLMREWY